MLINKPITFTKSGLIMAFLSSAVIGVGISYSDLYLFHIILSILIIFWFYQLKQNDYKFNFYVFRENYIFPPIIMFCWYLLSTFWAPDIALALKYVFYIFCGLTITLTIVHFSNSVGKLNIIFKILSVFFIIELIIALAESFTNFRMPISSYSSIISFFGKEPINLFYNDIMFYYGGFSPPTGFHWNTNNLAIAMIMILPFFLCSQNFYVKLFGVISITTISIMTASRAVFLGLILIYCLYLLVVKKRIGTLSLVWLITIVLFWGMNQLKESENPRINEVANSIEALQLYLEGDIDVGGSIEWRRKLVDNGLKALSETYGFGLGAGGSTANQERIGPVAGRFTSMHNFWVEILVEGGYLITIIMFFWYLGIVYNLYLISKVRTKTRLNYYSQSLLLSMISFVPSAIAASSTIYFFPMWIMFGMSISVILLYRKGQKLIVNNQIKSNVLQ